MKKSHFFMMIFVVVYCFTIPLAAQNSEPVNEPLQKLIEGNKRFVTVTSIHPDQSQERLSEVYKSQHPFAVVVGCSDSRVPPEIIFDQGIGDLFVIRLAGNVVDSLAIGSIEYAVEHLGTNLILVLGHENCGAVTAALKGGEHQDHIHKIVSEINANIKNTDSEKDMTIENAVTTNVKKVVEELKSSDPILKIHTDKNNLKIMGGYYRLKDGQVLFFD